MADELDKIDLSKMNLKDLQSLKNEAIARLKKAVDSTIELAGHQSGSHQSHVNHSTS